MTETTTPPAALDDAALMVMAARREPEAFRVLYERHRDAVHRCARRYAHGRADAEDLVAEAFARILELFRAGEGPRTAFRAYACTVVRNLAAERSRRSAREPVVADLPERRDPRDEPNVTIEREHVRRALAKLPERWRRILWLSEVEGRDPAEMGAIMGVAPGAVSALAYRAREGLRQAYLLVHVGSGTPVGCRRTVDRLPSYLRDSISPTYADQVRDHLRGCEFCRARLRELAELDRHLRVLILPVLLGGTALVPAFAPGMLPGARALRRVRDSRHGPTGAVAGGLAAAVAAAGFLVATIPAGHESPIGLPGPVAGGQVPDRPRPLPPPWRPPGPTSDPGSGPGSGPASDPASGPASPARAQPVAMVEPMSRAKKPAAPKATPPKQRQKKKSKKAPRPERDRTPAERPAQPKKPVPDLRPKPDRPSTKPPAVPEVPPPNQEPRPEPPHTREPRSEPPPSISFSKPRRKIRLEIRVKIRLSLKPHRHVREIRSSDERPRSRHASRSSSRD